MPFRSNSHKGVRGLRDLSMGSTCCAGMRSHVQIPSIHEKAAMVASNPSTGCEDGRQDDPGGSLNSQVNQNDKLQI